MTQLLHTQSKTCLEASTFYFSIVHSLVKPVLYWMSVYVACIKHFQHACAANIFAAAAATGSYQ